jgi:hypothetical protein
MMVPPAFFGARPGRRAVDNVGTAPSCSADNGPVLSSDRPVLPGWLPVLQRASGVVQVGLDPRAGLIVEGVPDALPDLLSLLDGAHSVAELTAEAADRGIGEDVLLQVLRSLAAAGLLDSPATGPARPLGGGRVRLIGAGALGQETAYALLAAGVGELHLVDPDPVDLLRYPRPGLATSQARALAAALQEHRVTLRVADHWSDPSLPTPELTVIATDRYEPDRAIGLDYLRDDHPHLYLRPLPGGAIVGPFVRPGLTPCLGCLDLVRAGADPDWPTLLAQLCRRQAIVEPLLARWAAVTAVTQLAADLNARPGTLAGTMEMTAPDCEMRYRRWPMHPACGCGWLP